MRVVLLWLVSLTACSGLLGIEDVSLGGKPGPGSDAGTDAGVDRTPSTVHGTASTLHYVSPTETATVPLDVSGYVFQAYAPDDSDAGFRIIDGVGTRDGTFTIPDVPGGSYYLFVQAPGALVLHFFETSSRTPEIGLSANGRVDGPAAVASTPLMLHLTGMTPMVLGDTVFIESRSLGVVQRLTNL